MAARSDSCVTSRMSWPSMVIAAAGHVVEAEEQPRDGRLAGARRADDGDGPAGRHLEADALEDRPRRGRSGRRHPRSGPSRRRRRAAWRPGLSTISGGDVEEVEHRLDVDQPLLDLAIDEADEVERDGELHQQRVDQHEIADRLLAAHDRRARHHHADGHADGEDDDLADVEPGERGPDADRRLLVARHRRGRSASPPSSRCRNI